MRHVPPPRWSLKPTQQGFLLATSPSSLLLLHTPVTLGRLLTTLTLLVLQLVGALQLGRRPLAARLMLTGAVLGSGLLAGWQAARTPLGALVLFVVVLGVLAWLWSDPEPELRAPSERGDLQRGGCWGMVLLVVTGMLVPHPTPWTWSAVVLAPVIAGLLWMQGRAARDGATSTPGATHWSDFVFASPARALVLTFLALMAVGTLLLALPPAGRGQPTSLIDALFTATSATCVTGLVVRDTASGFTPLGQVVILTLIQVGGLGIMIFSLAGMALAGRRISLRLESTAVEIVGTRDRGRVTEAARTVLLVTLVAEAAGTLLLTAMFMAGGDSVGQALWRGLFTAISAFCNAGFALQSDSLMGYQHQVGIVLVVAVLVVVGGLGPAVVRAAPGWVRGKPTSLGARIALWTTIVLLGPGSLLLLAMEWHGALRSMDWGPRLANALFLAVTPRTAGFNSVDTARLRPVTLWFTMALMFIGGSPGSTAGGIKTTTSALLVLMILAALVGRTHVRALGMRVAQSSVYRATAIAALATLSMVVVVAVLELTQEMPLDMAAFESISALGTVGLSVGGTAHLDAVGKLVVAATMFAGRVGPLTLFMFLSTRTASDRFELPEDEVGVG